jgi:hypothetical protein
MRYLLVDGMLSGTGVRDAIGGGYVDLAELGLLPNVVQLITGWLARYETAHYRQFDEPQEVQALDEIGLELCDRLARNFRETRLDTFPLLVWKS